MLKRRLIRPGGGMIPLREPIERIRRSRSSAGAGTGRTTLARIIADITQARFVIVAAVATSRPSAAQRQADRELVAAPGRRAQPTINRRP
jgi:hypothetical protein